MRRRVVAVLLVAGLGACGDDGPVLGEPAGSPTTADVDVPGAEVADGFAVGEVVTGLTRPTQIAFDDEGRLLVAQLAGGEDAGAGQVVRIDPDAPGEPEVVADGLLTPTGVTVADGTIWVMEQRSLGRIDDDGSIEVVLDQLPFNGRSEGTLTTAPDGSVLFNTSGSISGSAPTPGSGALWSLAPGAGAPDVVATGLKNGYARTFDAEGRLWSVEMSDGSFDGEPAPDEVMLVEPGMDFAWPRCIGDRRPVAQYGGSDDECAGSPPSLALFEPGATPTSIAVAPWDPDLLVVALWNRGQVVSVSTVDHESAGPVEPTVLLSGIEHPQHLLVDGDRLLLSDHDGGRVLSITASG